MPRKSAAGRTRLTPWTAPAMRQQTITQMDPFFSIFHPDAAEEDFTYETHNPEVASSPVRARKRRKISALRNSKTAWQQSDNPNANHHHPAREGATGSTSSPRARVRNENDEDVVPRGAQCLARPRVPTTPISGHRVIPSSQSPAGTPGSMQRSSKRETQHRSPLAERSLNIVSKRLFSASRPEHPAMRELPNSMDDEENAKAEATPTNITSMEAKDRQDAFPQHAGLSRTSTTALELEPGDQSSIPSEAAQSQPATLSKPVASPPSLLIKTEIEDSDEDDDGNFGRGETHDLSRNTMHSHRQTMLEAASKADQVDIGTQSAGPRAPPLLQAESSSNSAVEPPSKACPRSDSDLASAQLKSELRSSTQNRLSATESQLDDRWQAPHPESPQTIPPSSAPPTSALALEVQNSTSSFATTIWTQLLPRTSQAERPFPLDCPVPPSQATTVDTTHDSPATPRGKRNAQASLAQQSFGFPRPAKPPAILPSSSPLAAEPAEGDIGTFTWDRDILSDSQLLPESLMNDSVGRPPFVFESDDDEEVEGETWE